MYRVSKVLSVFKKVRWCGLVAVAFRTALPVSAAPLAALAGAPPVMDVRIALVTDTHTTRGTAKDQPLYCTRLDKVIADVNAKDVAWVLIAGDLTQGGKADELADFQAQIKGFKAPVSCVFGNHDVGAKIKEGAKEGVTAARLERFETVMGPAFWSRERAGIRVVGVASSLFGSGLKAEDEQWAFLKKILAPPTEKPAGSTPATIPTLLLTHYPLFLRTFDEPGDDYWNIEPEPRQRLMGLLQKGGVRAVLSGHLHRPLLNRYQGLSLITAPPVSFGLPRDKQPQGWMLLTISPRGEVKAEVQSIQD